jgi:hypothetical protein
MSRINEVLNLTTDEQRIAWYWSLTDQERDELSDDFVAMETKLLAVWKAVEVSVQVLVENMQPFLKSLAEIGEALSAAFANYASSSSYYASRQYTCRDGEERCKAAASVDEVGVYKRCTLPKGHQGSHLTSNDMEFE